MNKDEIQMNKIRISLSSVPKQFGIYSNTSMIKIHYEGSLSQNH